MPGNESVISAPPPPPEVKVRTMQSDLASMAKSGGGAPRFENVKVEGWEPRGGTTKRGERINGGMPPGMGTGAPGGAAAAPAAAGKGRGIMRIAVIVLVLLALAAIGYFIYTTFLSGNGANQSPSENQSSTNQAAAPPASLPPAALPESSTVPSSAPPTSAPPASTTAPAGPFTHVSLFTKPVDETLTFTLSSGGPAQTAADLESFNQKMTSLLGQAKNGASFIEIDVVGSDGNGVPVGDIWTQAGSAVLDPQFLATHFSPDATFFVYRDASGNFWPGYVLALASGGNWLFLQNDVAKLESSPAIADFFLTNVGLPTGGFGNSTISGAAVRVLSYPTANPPASFVYGWSHGSNSFLILSTSENGFAAALAHL